MTKTVRNEEGSRISVTCPACGLVYGIWMGASTDTIREVSCPGCHKPLGERRVAKPQ